MRWRWIASGLCLLACAEAAAFADGAPGPRTAAATERLDSRAHPVAAGAAVRVGLPSGRAVEGRLLTIEGGRAVVITQPLGEVRVFSEDDVWIVARTKRAPSRAADTRHLGLSFGVAPSVMLDFEREHIYAFANASIVFPLAEIGPAFSAGVGYTVPFTRRTKWHFDAFAYSNSFVPYATGSDDLGLPFELSLGLGVGVHYTSDTGFTMGIKAPIIGCTVAPTAYVRRGGSDCIGPFYLASVLALPLLNFGYRY